MVDDLVVIDWLYYGDAMLDVAAFWGVNDRDLETAARKYLMRQTRLRHKQNRPGDRPGR